jgi:hypothetical protein
MPHSPVGAFRPAALQAFMASPARELSRPKQNRGITR